LRTERSETDPARPKIVVGSGWWFDGRARDWTVGELVTRSPAFFDLWLGLVRKYIEPDLIVVIDSHAPIKPRRSARESVTWIELDRNYGHANDLRLGLITTRHSGGTRARIMGCAYALCCDADYFVYLEQDCVIRGKGFIDAALRGTTHPIVIGDRTTGGRNIVPGRIAAPMFQNSLIIVRRDGMERCLNALVSAPEPDGEVPPEAKMERNFQPFDVLAIPYGRSRPIDFGRSHFYAQHLVAEELAEFCQLEQVDPTMFTSPMTPGG
jgi:hypothetical protein